MTAIGISGLGRTGVIRMTWVRDDLAHVLHHSHTDETTGTWTGLACPAYGLSLGTDVDDTVLRRLAAHGEIADLTWEAPDDITAEHGQAFQAAIRAYHAADTQHAEQLWESVRAIWSQAWSANYAALELLQATGLTRFSPVKPQQWVIASFEHHTSPHGLPRPHIHNIVLTAMTTAAS
jgi:TrwC relaxase